jgi:hypothetical protein
MGVGGKRGGGCVGGWVGERVVSFFGANVGGMRMVGLDLCPKREPETPIRGGYVKVEGLGLDPRPKP